MCGIIGYYRLKQLVPILIDGLRRLGITGYDSAGVAVVLANRSSWGAAPAGWRGWKSSPLIRSKANTASATPAGPLCRQADRGERAPAPRLHQPHRRRPQQIIELHSS